MVSTQPYYYGDDGALDEELFLGEEVDFWCADVGPDRCPAHSAEEERHLADLASWEWYTAPDIW